MRSGAVVATVVATLVAGCALGGTTPAPRAPAFRSADCPDRITAEILTPVTCGWVTVPERHAEQEGPTIELFVARVLPAGRVSGEPALWLGYDVGGTVEYGSMATLAPRIHREVVILDPRGTGFSMPHLGCPEVAAAAPAIVARPSGNTEARSAFRDAVTACHARLTDAGVDVAAYGLDEIANDVTAVMGALDLPTVSLYSGGTASRLELATLRDAERGSVRVALLDNGPSTGAADEALTAAALPEALAAADLLCDATCEVTGRPSERVAALVDQLDAAPVPTTTRDGIPVLLDGARLQGVAAWHLERHIGGADLAARIAAVVAEPGAAALTTAEQVLCLGQRPKCEAPTFSYGVWWTIQCRDEAPPSGDVQADVCAQWPVGRSAEELRAPVESEVPLLALYAGLNPYVPVSERDLAALGRRTVVVDPTRGADVMVGCVRSWRDQWMDDPTTEPAGLCPAVTPAVTGTRTWTSS